MIHHHKLVLLYCTCTAACTIMLTKYRGGGYNTLLEQDFAPKVRREDFIWKWSRVGRTFLFTPPPPTHLIQNAWFDANDHALLNRSNTRTTRANIGQRHVVRSCLPWKFEMCNEKIRDSTVGSYCFRIECPQARLVETLYEKQYVINSSSTISLFLVSSCVQY